MVEGLDCEGVEEESKCKNKNNNKEKEKKERESSWSGKRVTLKWTAERQALVLFSCKTKV